MNASQRDKIEINAKPVTIKVDFREDDSRIGEILAQAYRVNVEREKLIVGDYIVDGQVVIERKTTLDFVQSVIDGRLFRQTARMKQFFDFSIFIVEGQNLYNTSVKIHPHAVKGALVSLGLMWQIPVLFTAHADDTALLLYLIGSQSANGYRELSCRQGRRPKRLRKRQLYILQGLPQVGPKLAFQLLDHFGSVDAVMTASEKELINVQGLGIMKAKKIKEAVSKVVS